MRILVVGSGVAGLGALRALDQHGIDAEIVERSAGFPPEGTGFYLPGNGMRALARLGAEAAVLDTGKVITWQRVCDSSGGLLGEASLEELWGDIGPCCAFPRWELHAALLGVVDGARLTYRRAVTDLRPAGEAVAVHFDDGSVGKYDLVIGADGVHSRVRERWFDSPAPTFAEENYWRFVVDDLKAVDQWTGLWCDELFFGLVPLGGGRVYCCGLLLSDDPHDEPAPGRAPRFKSRFACFGGVAAEALARLAPTDPLHYDQALTVFADPPFRDRVVLIGDAAHATPPSMAEGASMALEDALVLAEMLAAHDVDEALAAFAARRTPRTRYVQEATRMRTFAARQPSEVRDEAFRQYFAAATAAMFEPLKSEP